MKMTRVASLKLYSFILSLCSHWAFIRENVFLAESNLQDNLEVLILSKQHLVRKVDRWMYDLQVYVLFQ